MNRTQVCETLLYWWSEEGTPLSPLRFAQFFRLTAIGVRKVPNATPKLREQPHDAIVHKTRQIEWTTEQYFMLRLLNVGEQDWWSSRPMQCRGNYLVPTHINPFSPTYDNTSQKST